MGYRTLTVGIRVLILAITASVADAVHSKDQAGEAMNLGNALTIGPWLQKTSDDNKQNMNTSISRNEHSKKQSEHQDIMAKCE